ncbi:MAG: Trp biosynthesis-associated membrane protein [Sporichthyaceae bacterium]|nr:Trp biosynthesis-associated membrane protein [Sporichthyaceae bacterium]
MSDGAEPAAGPVRARRALTVVVLACLAGAGLALLAGGQTWASAVATGGPAGSVAVRASGTDIVPVVAALGLVALAGSVAVLAARRTGRRLVGVLLVLAGAGIGAGALAGRAGPEPAIREAAGEATGRIGATVSELTVTGWPWLALLGGLLVLASGAAAALTGPRWAAMSSRYQRPAGRTGTATSAESGDAWSALDHGTDPTV